MSANDAYENAPQMNQNTVTREMMAWIRQDVLKCKSCHGKGTVECYRDADETCLECQSKRVLLAEYDELRSQDPALESQLAEFKERCEELRIAWKVTKEQLAEARKDTERLVFLVEKGLCVLSTLVLGEMRYWLADRDAYIQPGYFLSARAAIDAAGALRAKSDTLASSEGLPTDTVPSQGGRDS